MPIGKTHNSDCVFKKREGSKIICTFPKKTKICYTCSCYVKNDGDLDQKIKFISLVLARKTANLAITISFLSLLVSISTLGLKIYETNEPKNNPTLLQSSFKDSLQLQ